MTKFIIGQDLEKVVSETIWEAKATLPIVSPFIRFEDSKRVYQHRSKYYSTAMNSKEATLIAPSRTYASRLRPGY